ncbi:MAG TPA: heme-binding protein [Polyangia bacterium]|jgi:glc operon protein GlcG|nr:heme-binding protein [Polyangia bacterium]
MRSVSFFVTNNRVRVVVAACLGLVAGAARAAEPPSLVTQKALTLDGARGLIAAAQKVAHARHTTGTVAVVDDGGNLMALERLDGTFAAGANIAIGKARTAAQFKKPTRFFEDVIAKGRTAMTALPDFTPLAGGLPLLVDGQVVGAVGVSGAASAKEDEELAQIAASALVAPPTAVRLIDKERVTAAFVKGEPLVETSDYKVHASHRDSAGKSEVHLGDTDILYMLSGSATVVTGGTVVDPVTVEPGEIRGASIKGGDRRQLVPGDVMIVPKGVPHWFQAVSGPIDYYAVKVH